MTAGGGTPGDTDGKCMVTAVADADKIRALLTMRHVLNHANSALPK